MTLFGADGYGAFSSSRLLVFSVGLFPSVTLSFYKMKLNITGVSRDS